MDTNVISPSSRTRLVVASQALEIQHLQDLLRATERDLNDTTAKLVAEKQDLERRLASEQSKSKRLDEQVRVLGEKLRQTEQQLAAATAGGVAGSPSLGSAGGGGSPSRSPNVLDSVMGLGGAGGGSSQQNPYGDSFGVDAASAMAADGGATSPQQQQQLPLMKRVAELNASNAALAQERDMLRAALEDMSSQQQHRTGSQQLADPSNSMLAAMASNNSARGASAGGLLLDAPDSCAVAVQTSDPTIDILDGAVDAASVEDIRNMIVNEQQLQKYFQQLGVLHASNAAQLADAMQRKIENEMSRLQQQHDEYRKMLHSVPVVSAPNGEGGGNSNQQQHTSVFTSGNNVPGQPHLVSPFPQQQQGMNQTPRGTFGGGANSSRMQQQQPQQQEQGDVGFIKQQQHEMTVLKRRLDELQERHKSLRDHDYGQHPPATARGGGNNEQQHLSSTTMPPSAWQHAQQHQHQHRDQSEFAARGAAPQHQQQQQQTQQGPVPRALFPVKTSFGSSSVWASGHDNNSSAAAAAAPPSPAQSPAAASGSSGMPAAVGAAQTRMDNSNRAGSTASSSGVMQRMFSKAASIL